MTTQHGNPDLTMAARVPARRVAVVGTGTIGASWATHYLACGFDVVATDPAPGAEAALRSYVDDAWATAAAIGLAPGASPDRLSFTADLRRAGHRHRSRPGRRPHVGDRPGR